MKSWYVLQSRPLKEGLLWEQLFLRGIETYYPRIRVRPVNPRARKVKAYFPGYLFIHADLHEECISDLHWMPGVVGLVSFGNEPATVADELIQSIRQRVDEINRQGGEIFDELKPGVPIRICQGPFHGYKAIFDARLSEAGRVRVFLEVLKGQLLRMELPVEQIEYGKRLQY